MFGLTGQEKNKVDTAESIPHCLPLSVFENDTRRENSRSHKNLIKNKTKLT